MLISGKAKWPQPLDNMWRPVGCPSWALHTVGPVLHFSRVWERVWGREVYTEWFHLVFLCIKSPESCQTLCNPVDHSHQAPLSMGFSKHEYCSGLPCPPPGDLPDRDRSPGSSLVVAKYLLSDRWFSNWIGYTFPDCWKGQQKEKEERLESISTRPLDQQDDIKGFWRQG